MKSRDKEQDLDEGARELREQVEDLRTRLKNDDSRGELEQ